LEQRKLRKEYILIAKTFSDFDFPKRTEVPFVCERAARGHRLSVWLIEFIEKKKELLSLLESSEERVHRAMTLAKEADELLPDENPLRGVLQSDLLK